MDCNVRPATESDVSFISEAEKSLFVDAWSKKGIAEEFTNEYAKLFIAEAGGAKVGYCIVIESFDEADIVRIGVMPEFRRNGFATSLLEYVFEDGDRKGIMFYNLEVRKSNSPARALYERCGFLLEGYRPGFYSSPKEDAAMYRYERTGN
ncbi:MAG: ribosomal protein S18-alanine N-acetyltransferase [Lachnospiraceae bacterium]|nr:ribosomal protein S18-alanine N-acetyltransferase [Lachnospiraceae bacterium]